MVTVKDIRYNSFWFLIFNFVTASINFKKAPWYDKKFAQVEYCEASMARVGAFLC